MQNGAIVITGASDGIGRAMALAFARRGYRLELLSRRGDVLEEVRSECLALGSPQVEWASVDVTQSEAFRAALESLDVRLGGVGIFVANAGITGRSRVFEDGFADARRCLEVNVIAAVDGLEWMKARMLARGGGTLVGVSSVAATRGLPDSGAYSASKAALTTYLESMRIDLRGSGVKVLTIAPGFIDTPLTKKNRGKMPFLMPANEAGEIFARKVLAGQRFIVAPWQFWWIIQLLKVLPAALYEGVLGHFMGRIRGRYPPQIKN